MTDLFSLPLSTLVLLAAVGLYAGIQNTLAGGGSFITFPTLLLAGLDPLAANMSSTIALFPNQISSSFAGRNLVGGVGKVKFKHLFMISILGGITGALLLLSTPVSVFTKLIPWLVLFATSIFAWGSFFRKPSHAQEQLQTPRYVLLFVQFLIAIYGGYFGGGIGFLMLAALTFAGQQVKVANATKNALSMTMNASAVAIFIFSPSINWSAVFALGIGGILGGFSGVWLMNKLPDKWLRLFIVCVGTSLTIWLFIR